ncbi:MAG TPA: Hsp20 family protein [Symbiobacteriaceae bacterium]
MFLSLLDLVRHRGAFALPALAAPTVQIEQVGGSLWCRTRLPGIDPRTVQVQVRETSLALAGYGTMEERTQGPDFFRAQSAMRSFYREVPLPARVDPHRCVMQWRGDVLEIICPLR